MMGYCAAYGKEIQDAKQDESIAQITAKFTDPQRAAFATLNKIKGEYASAVASGEVDLSGTARAMFQIDAEQTINSNFVAALQAFESGKLPTGTAKDAALADAELNRVYKKQLAEAAKPDNGTVKPEGIRAAERAWLKYRDAWLTFAQLRYPQVSADAWLTLLSRDRAMTLKDPYCDMDEDSPGCKQYTNGPLPLP